MSSIEELPKPARVTGGCLCGAIRYRVDFPHDYDFAKNVSEFSLLHTGLMLCVKVHFVRSANDCLVDWHLSMHPVPSQLGLNLLVVRSGSKSPPPMGQGGRKNHNCQSNRGVDGF